MVMEFKIQVKMLMVINFNALDCQGSDHDWYKIGTTDQADAITDNLYTKWTCYN